MAQVFTLPHKWTPEQKLAVARALLPKLYLKGSYVGREREPAHMALALRDDRVGAQALWLALPEPAAESSDARRQRAVDKLLRDGRLSLQIELDSERDRVQKELRETTQQLEQLLRDSARRLEEQRQRDVALSDEIEDINSGKGLELPDAVDGGSEAALAQRRQQQNERRRALKAERKALKDDSKALQAQVAAWKRDLQLAEERARIAIEKAEQRFQGAVVALTQDAEAATRWLWSEPPQERARPQPQTQPRTPATSASSSPTRRWCPRPHLADTTRSTEFLASGACRIDGARYRFSVFAVGDGSDWFELAFYDAATSQRRQLRVSRLEWIGLTKRQHDAQLQIPSLAPPPPSERSVCTRLAELRASYDHARQALHKLKKKTAKSDAKRQQLRAQLAACAQVEGACWRAAPWTQVVQALCQRLRIEGSELTLDRCIYEATLPIVSIIEDEVDEEEEGDDVIGDRTKKTRRRR
ncbi:hypothetical protein PINS_up008856 [Pythium insidiosum]|nr:hypothetical protein PINS_up008856 [Pythium insidiosum]